MSLLDSQGQQIEIKLYYEEKITKLGYRKIVVIEDEKAEGIMEKEKAAMKEKQEKGESVLKTDKTIQCLTTKWKVMSWGDQNKITKSAEKYTPDGMQDIDMFKFRDLRIKQCLVDWDLTGNKGGKIPVSSQTIDMLPSDVVFALVSKYDRIVSIDEEEEEKIKKDTESQGVWY